MAVVRYVSFFPPTGFRDRPWDRDPAIDALVKSGRRVAELLSEEVARLRLEGPSSEVRVLCEPADGPDVEVQVNLEPNAFGYVQACVPASVARLSPRARARVALEILFGTLVELASVRGWDHDGLARARDGCLDRQLEYVWRSPWKASPDRRWEARGTFWLEDHGFGGAVLEARPRGVADAQVHRSPSVEAFCTSAGFQRSARSLRWARDRVSMEPSIGLFGASVGRDVSLRPGEGSSDPDWQPPAAAGSGSVELPAVRFVQRERRPVEPGIRVVGGTRVPGAERSYGRAIERHFSRLPGRAPRGGSRRTAMSWRSVTRCKGTTLSGGSSYAASRTG